MDKNDLAMGIVGMVCVTLVILAIFGTIIASVIKCKGVEEAYIKAGYTRKAIVYQTNYNSGTNWVKE